MKYIFDFDDVLFNNTTQFKPHMFKCLEDAGISRDKAQEYYKKARIKFSLMDFITALLAKEKIIKIDEKKLYKKITAKNKNFVNTELLKIVKKIGKSNCYMVTHGERKYQLDKIKRTGIIPLFSRIIIIQGSKKQAVENICAKYKNETVVFIDDKADRFEDIDFKKFPNLKTILYAKKSFKNIIKKMYGNQ